MATSKRIKKNRPHTARDRQPDAASGAGDQRPAAAEISERKRPRQRCFRRHIRDPPMSLQWSISTVTVPRACVFGPRRQSGRLLSSLQDSRFGRSTSPGELFREGDGGGEPIGPAANHKRSGHATAPNQGSVAGRVHVTCNGIGPLGSQGCSATASVTFQVPRSVTPSAASMTL